MAIVARTRILMHASGSAGAVCGLHNAIVLLVYSRGALMPIMRCRAP